MKKLMLQITDLSNYIDLAESIKPSISKVPIAWHIHHSLAVIIGISKALDKSNPEDYHFQFNIARIYIMTRGSIPRGKGKAPDRVNKKEAISREELTEMIKESREIIGSLEKLPTKAYFNHPYFGHLKKKSAIRFLKMHNEHHLKIIRKILNSSS